MEVKVKDKIVYLGFLLFALSLVGAALNEKIAIILLVASFGTLVFGGLFKD